jgi:hypothetical protein
MRIKTNGRELPINVRMEWQPIATAPYDCDLELAVIDAEGIHLVMRVDAGLHADQARRQVGKSRLDLATRPFLPKHDRTTLILSHHVERVLADIDAAAPFARL